ncbi:MAG: PEGA domain-containing protein, partial [Bacteroidales bacterium]|nr:PEGA domain-containing protein [Bacteroidales bacterium]
FGYITVKSTPSGAEVYIDEKKAGATPYQMKKIKRGQHVVELRKEGYEPFADMVTIKAGEVNRQFEDVTLEAVKVATGTIVLESNPSGAVITIDGRQYGQTPKTLTDFPVGAYTVYFTKDGYQNLAQNIDLKDGGRETLSVTMSKTSAPQQPVAQQQPVQQQPVPQQPAPTGTVSGQNTSPLKVIEFRMIPNGIMDEGRLEKNQRTDYDNNPVCEIKVKAQGFDEGVMQRFKFSADGPWITKVEFDDKNEWRIYLSSNIRGSLKIKYQGDCVFDFPGELKPKAIYELTLGMEPVVPQQPVAAGAGGTAAAGNTNKSSALTGSVDGHEYVDLGLPSGTLWATCNVGAGSPEDYGDYFAWGETNTKNNYDWSTYKWCRGSYDSQTKYNTKSVYGTVDNRTVLEMSDDAAHVSWGAGWRMPTTEEWEELYDKCTWMWTTQGGKNGYRVTGPNGKSMFLPAAGGRDGTVVDDAGSDGYYWSSSLSSSFPDLAYSMDFSSGGVSPQGDSSRCYGFTVRPVRVAR